MLIDATSQTPDGRVAGTNTILTPPAFASAWNAVGASAFRIVSTSRCTPTAFIKMNGNRASDQLDCYPLRLALGFPGPAAAGLHLLPEPALPSETDPAG